MKIKTQKVNSSLAINKIVIEQEQEKTVVVNGKNVIFAIDVSGSMYDSLPKIRQQLKNKIPSIISDIDTISIVWFSGRNQAGILKEGVRVKNLVDLQQLNDAIDRFLVPVGMTAFLPPITLTETLISNLSSNGNCFSFIFLSDGYNNDSSWSEVIAALAGLESKLASATFIEYGYYADSDALTEMTEIVGGEKIFSKDFDSYEENFDKIVTKQSTASKITLDISEVKNKLANQFFYTIDKVNEIINVYSANGKTEISIPNDTESVYFFSRSSSGNSDDLNATEILAAAYVLAERLKYGQVEDILAMLGDISLIKQFAGAYGKQKLNDLKDKLKVMTFDNSGLFSDGRDYNYVVDSKQYCFMDLIKDLQDGENSFYPYHPDFNYNRIGTKKVTKVELTDEAKDALKNAKTLKEITDIASQFSAAEFIYPDNAAEIGMKFNSLVWNQDRANLSVQTKLNGRVKLPKNDVGLNEVDSFIYRNYTLVKDGILNVTEIPVSLDHTTHAKLVEKGLLKDSQILYSPKGIYTLDISSLPTINRSMVTNMSAKSLANLEFGLLKLQLSQKYLKYLKEEFPVDTDKSVYTPEQAEWLKTIGLTEKGGFSPKVEAVKSEDFYVAPSLKVKIEKTSTSPKISDFVLKCKLLSENAPKAKSLNLVEGILKTKVAEMGRYLPAKYNLEDVEGLIKEIDKERRETLTDIAKIKFGIILSRSWFKEFSTLAENELRIKFDGLEDDLNVLFDYKEEQISI